MTQVRQNQIHNNNTWEDPEIFGQTEGRTMGQTNILITIRGVARIEPLLYMNKYYDYKLRLVPVGMQV